MKILEASTKALQNNLCKNKQKLIKNIKEFKNYRY